MHFVKSTIGLAAAGLLLAAVPAYAAGNRISLGDDYYNPKVKTVSKGTRVVWVNNGDDAHTVTTRNWSRRLDPGERYGRVVKRGFRYHCKFHDGMTGRIAIG
jgi:plastocyanin